MSRFHSSLLPLLLLSLACPVPASALDDAPVTAAPASTAAAGQACVAQQEFERMDDRTPVPLLPMMAHHQKQNMRDHLVAVQEIVAGMSSNDFDAIERASQRIGYSDQMARMCTHMGAGAPGFTDQALNFHRTADTIAVAARQKDANGVAKALSATLQTCTGCHAVFRQQVVDEAQWSSITSMPPPAGPGPHGPGFGRGRCADPAAPDCPRAGPRSPR